MWASLVAQTVENPPAMRETWVRSLGWEDPLEEGMTTHSSILAWRIPMDRGLSFLGGSDRKEPACNGGDLGSIPGSGRYPGKGHGNPLQYSYLENPHGQKSLAGYSPWGCKESDTTERHTMWNGPLSDKTLPRRYIPLGANLSHRPLTSKEKGTNFYWVYPACHVFGASKSWVVFLYTPTSPLAFTLLP